MRATHCLPNGKEIPTEVYFVRIPYQSDYIVVSYTRDMRQQLASEERAHKFNTRLQSILNATPLCLNLWNRRFENTMCNQAAIELFSLNNPEEYINEFSSLSPEHQPGGRSSQEASLDRIRQAFETGSCQFRWLHCGLSGEPIPAEITLVRIDGLDDDGGDMVAGFTRDLRPQLLAEKVERNAAQRIKAVMDATPLACLSWTVEGQVTDCNQVAVTMFGAHDKSDIIAHFDAFLPERQTDGLLSLEKKNQLLKEVRQKGSCSFEWVYQKPDGDTIPAAVSLVLLHINEEKMIVAYSQDLRELQQTLEINKRLEQMAYYDWLTGSISRARFMEECDTHFHALRDGDLFSLLIFDFDNFKGVNDTYGHEIGDTVLKEVVKKVTSLLPSKASVGRYGGDEFLIQIRGTTRQELEQFLHTVFSAVRNLRFMKNEKTFTVSISLGGTYWTPDDTTLEMLINRADQALYKAKHHGRNRSVIL